MQTTLWDSQLPYLKDHELKELSKRINDCRKSRYPYVSHYCETKSFRPGEQEALLAACKPKEYRQQLLLKVLFKTGRRISEVTPLNIIDVNLEERSLFFKLQKQHIGCFKVPITDETLFHDIYNYIEKYKENILGHKGFLFWSENAYYKRDYFSANYMGNFFRTLCKRVGIRDYYAVSTTGHFLKRLSTHSARNTAIEKAIFELNIPLPIVQRMAGVKNFNTIMAYAKKVPAPILEEEWKNLQTKL